MIDANILTKADRVELLNGEIVDMSPIGSKHHGVVNFLLAFFRGLDQEEAIISVQGPILLDDHSEPQPDLALLKFRADYYRDSNAGPTDVLLLIEVADSSLETDRRVKASLYAAAGIAELWIVDVNDRSIEVHRHPVERRYLQVQKVKVPGKISAESFPRLILQLDKLFPQ